MKRKSHKSQIAIVVFIETKLMMMNSICKRPNETKTNDKKIKNHLHAVLEVFGSIKICNNIMLSVGKHQRVPIAIPLQDLDVEIV